MLLTLIRNTKWSNTTQTVGVLEVCGVPFCNTIEPPEGGNALQPKGCIPRGWYKVQVTKSPKFGRALPLLQMVPGFEGIRIHAGTRVENTRGCICVGERWVEEKLTRVLAKAQEKHEEIYICITDSDRVDVELQHTAPFGNSYPG